MFKNHDLHLRQQVVEEVTPEAPRKRKPPVAIEPDTSVAPTQVASPSSFETPAKVPKVDEPKVPEPSAPSEPATPEQMLPDRQEFEESMRRHDSQGTLMWLSYQGICQVRQVRVFLFCCLFKVSLKNVFSSFFGPVFLMAIQVMCHLARSMRSSPRTSPNSG